MHQTQRVVRVFLSSTFSDFVDERHLLVTQVFPELRRRCRSRLVDLVEVDLRWGITAEQAERGEVLPICLAEIDRCRPYFVGMLGERYGWVPEAHTFPPALCETQPWLQAYQGLRSVTELEILHGVLNNPAMAGRAFFYFRSPAASQALGPIGISSSELDAKRLHSLKQRIRESPFPVREGCRSAGEMVSQIQEDLWKAIDAEYPALDVPDELQRQVQEHDAFAQTRLSTFVEQADAWPVLDSLLQPDEEERTPGACGAGRLGLWQDGPRHEGTCQRAVNWQWVGRTAGTGKKCTVRPWVMPMNDIWPHLPRQQCAEVLRGK